LEVSSVRGWPERAAASAFKIGQLRDKWKYLVAHDLIADGYLPVPDQDERKEQRGEPVPA